MLYIVSTPIGNLKDITLRALEVLKSVDLIAAEDTRQTKKLSQHYGINTPLTSYFEYNKFRKGDFLLGLLKQGQKIALVSDSGTPGISDPGYHLINLAIKNNIPVTSIPGPTAVIAALSLSGMPTDKFVFEGFLSAKRVARKKRLAELAGEKRTVIIYESPHRLIKCLKDIAEILNDPLIVCARELTKKFEEVKRERASQLIEHFTKNRPRGEFVLIFNPNL
ncbi:MAG: 16S rRNA (cytidine(1402)-2'-O)-methyltransferase [Candidatus Omnitrophica bacterium]|nr:16S rRNA (cytidine(1402)-2'-O)-methyltransferase [Candidatus Omnitrophota bacterium]